MKQKGYDQVIEEVAYNKEASFVSFHQDEIPTTPFTKSTHSIQSANIAGTVISQPACDV